MSEKKFRGKLCMVCDTQATRFLDGYAYCDFHDRVTGPRLPSMGADSRVFREPVASPQATRPCDCKPIEFEDGPRHHIDCASRAAQPAAGTTPCKFRKKPVVIDAIRVSEKNLDDVRDFLGGEELRNINFGINYAHATVHIITLEGTMKADTGDWIIKGVKGEFYPCKPDIFEATYEPAE